MTALVEILIFAALSIYLFLKLRDVLGTRTGTENPPSFMADENDADSKVVPFPQGGKDMIIEGEFSPPLQEAISKLEKRDSSFEIHDFLDGAKKAFQMVIEAFSRNDVETLRMLLTKAVFYQFEKAINERKAQGHVLERHIENILNADPLEISFDDVMVRIHVKFVTDQLIITRDGDKLILDNPSRMITRLIDIWTFERKIQNSDDFWLLSATRSDA